MAGFGRGDGYPPRDDSEGNTGTVAVPTAGAIFATSSEESRHR